MTAFIIIALVGIVAYLLGRNKVQAPVQSATSGTEERKDLEPNTFFSVIVNWETIAKHSFVQHSVIPILRKHGGELSFKQELARIKKTKLAEELSPRELTERAWSMVVYHQIQKACGYYAKDTGLSFGLLGTVPNLNGALVWDNLKKTIGPMASSGEEFFKLPLIEPGNMFGDVDEVYIKGRFKMVTRAGEQQYVLKIYLYTMFPPAGEKATVGELCEVPFRFFRADRFDLMQDRAVAEQLLSVFDLKFNKYYKPHDDFYEDELGENQMAGGNTDVAVGNEFVSVYIR
jgi:hypothetical protein